MEQNKTEIKNKYHNSKIYTIRSHQTDKYYVGSTYDSLSKRLYQHKNHFKQFQAGKYPNVSSFEIIKYDDCYIELYEMFKCESRIELTKREGEVIRLLKDDLVNVKIEGRTMKEYQVDNADKIKQYYVENADKIKQYQKQYIKQYYVENADKIKQNHKQYYVENADKIKQYTKQYINDNAEKLKQKNNCVCGGKYSTINKSHHLRTKKHLNCIQKNTLSELEELEKLEIEFNKI